MIHLQHLVTVAGAHTWPQARLADELHDRIAPLPDAHPVAQMVRFVYERSTIRERHIELPLEEIAERDDWVRLVNDATLAMCTRALEKLFGAERSVPAARCDGLVVVSSSFAGFPALSRQVQQKSGFPSDALCFDLGGLGCAGPTQGLSLAAMLIAQGACRNVCVVCVDAMGTHGEARRHTVPPTMAQVVAHCLASDGAGAVVLGLDPGAQPVLSFREARLRNQLWPDSLDQNDFSADAENQPTMAVGKEIRTRLTDELGPLLDGAALTEPIFFHPGGAALMALMAEKWPALSETIAISSHVLAHHGNLGSSSLLWVLERALSQAATITPRLRLVALGPGIVSTILLLDGVER